MRISSVTLKIALGAFGALVLLAGVWYAAGLRSENRLLRDQLAKYEGQEATARREPAARRPPRPPIPGTDSGARVLTEEARDAMWAELSSQTGGRVWFLTQANDPEADLFQREIESTFLEAGWEIADSIQSRVPLREGVKVFIASDDIADYIAVAVNGLRAAGIDVFVGRDYRAFYEERKQQDPSFSGVELTPDQDFVIVVGPKPATP